MTALQADHGARPATHIWCFICKCPKPYQNKPLPDASKQRRPDLDGDYLVCQGCSTTVATVYGPAEANGAAA